MKGYGGQGDHGSDGDHFRCFLVLSLGTGSADCSNEAIAERYRAVSSSEVGRYSYSETPIGCVMPRKAHSTVSALCCLHRVSPIEGWSLGGRRNTSASIER